MGEGGGAMMKLGSCGAGRTKPTVNDCETFDSLVAHYLLLSDRQREAAELWFGFRGQMACALEDASCLAASLGGPFHFVLRPMLATWVAAIRQEVLAHGEAG